jgi:hypothetical protein
VLEKLRQKLWETIYLNPVWPHELIENTKDPDYLSVNYKTGNIGIEVELIFKDNEEIVTSIYYFDSNDFLQKAVMIESEKESIFYSRQDEISSLLGQILKIDKTFSLKQLSA